MSQGCWGENSTSNSIPSELPVRYVCFQHNLQFTKTKYSFLFVTDAGLLMILVERFKIVHFVTSSISKKKKRCTATKRKTSEFHATIYKKNNNNNLSLFAVCVSPILWQMTGSLPFKQWDLLYHRNISVYVVYSLS